MRKSDILIAKLKLRSKLEDRKRIKGYSFSHEKKEKRYQSSTSRQFRKERQFRKALNEKEINNLRYYLFQVQKKIKNIEKNQKNNEETFKYINPNNKKESTFIKELKKYHRKKKDNVDVRSNNINLNENSNSENINKILTDIKNMSFNFYKAVNDINIRDKILEKKDNGSIGFFKEFFDKVKQIRNTYSAKEIRKKSSNTFKCSKNHLKHNTSLSNRTSNLNLYYSLLLHKRINPKISDESENSTNINIIDKTSIYNYKNNNTNYSNNIFHNKTGLNNISSDITYNKHNTFKPSSNNILKTKSKIGLKKNIKNFVINKPIYTSNYKYFVTNFKKIQVKIKENKIKRKEGHLTSYSNIDNYSKIREDMLMFKLKMKYLNTRFPQKKNKPIDKKKLLVNKFEQNFVKSEKKFDFLNFNIESYKKK